MLISKFNRSSEDDEDIYDEESMEYSNSDDESQKNKITKSKLKMIQGGKAPLDSDTNNEPNDSNDDEDDQDNDDDDDDEDVQGENQHEESIEPEPVGSRGKRKSMGTLNSRGSRSQARNSNIEMLNIKDRLPIYDMPLKTSSNNTNRSSQSKKVCSLIVEF